MTAKTNTAPQVRGKRKTRIGVVVSNKMMKTIVVRVLRLVRHDKYSRVIRRAATFKVHDDTNRAGLGDRVKIVETRPLSKDKRWRLVEIIQRASSAPAVPTVDQTVEPLMTRATPPEPGRAKTEGSAQSQPTAGRQVGG